MTLRGTDPESYITQYTSACEDQLTDSSEDDKLSALKENPKGCRTGLAAKLPKPLLETRPPESPPTELAYIYIFI